MFSLSFRNIFVLISFRSVIIRTVCLCQSCTARSNVSRRKYIDFHCLCIMLLRQVKKKIASFYFHLLALAWYVTFNIIFFLFFCYGYSCAKFGFHSLGNNICHVNAWEVNVLRTIRNGCNHKISSKNSQKLNVCLSDHLTQNFRKIKSKTNLHKLRWKRNEQQIVERERTDHLDAQ